MEITVKELINLLKLEDAESPVYFGGLDFYRIKDRSGCVQIEFNQTVDKDENSLVYVINHDISFITAYNRDGNRQKFNVRYEEREITQDCDLNGEVYIIFDPKNPAVGFNFELVNYGENYYIKYVDNNGIPEVTGKGIVKAMLVALSCLLKRDIYSSTNFSSQKLYSSEGLVDEMKLAWEKWRNELDNVEYLSDKGRYVFKYTI